MPKKESPDNTVVCTICGAESPVGSKRCEHCYSSLEPGQEEMAVPEGTPETDKNLEQLLQVPGVGEAKAEILFEAGYHTVDDLKKASVEQLSAIKGIGEKLASKIVQEVNIMGGPQSQSLANWFSGGQDDLGGGFSGDERSEPEAAAADREMPRDDTLVKWLSGEENDVNSWLDETRAQEAAPRAIGPNETRAGEAER